MDDRPKESPVPVSPWAPKRRGFLKTGALASAAVGLGGVAWPAEANGRTADAAPDELLPPAPSWIDRPMRWAQLTLVEDDPVKFDAAFWLDYFKRTHSDTVCRSAGSCVAYYPTQVPFHHKTVATGATLHWR